jgi:hypothetical protein
MQPTIGYDELEGERFSKTKVAVLSGAWSFKWVSWTK